MTTRSTLALALLLSGCGSDDTCDPATPGVICTVAGNGDQGFAGDGVPATEAALYIPLDMARAPSGEMWLLDFNNYVVRAIDADGRIRVVVGTGLLGDSPEPGTPPIATDQATFNHTTDIVFHDGFAYLAA